MNQFSTILTPGEIQLFVYLFLFVRLIVCVCVCLSIRPMIYRNHDWQKFVNMNRIELSKNNE